MKPKKTQTNKKKKTAAAVVHQLHGGRAGTKRELVLGMIREKTGATLAEIMKATGWQAHSVRGFIAATGKKLKVTIRSTKDEAGRRYKLGR